MKLYMVPAAPNPTKVTLYVAEKAAAGVELGIEQIVINTLQGAQKSSEHLARNPFGTIPVLEVTDGEYLIESLAIIEYLEELFPEASMWGRDALERAHARDVERIADGKVLVQIARYVHATRSPLGLPPNPAAADDALRALSSALGFLESLLADGRSLLLGEDVTVADCTLQDAFQFMRFGKAELIADHPNLIDWDVRYRKRPAAIGVLKF